TAIMYNDFQNTPLRNKEGIKAWLAGNEKNDWHIHEVKRLSDNEVFSVGDKVYYDDGGGSHANHWVIDHFYIRNDGVMLARGK
ncbi:hypothetical protein, partial [Escherichia coli]|uniref:hypothetical protein n=1 Tax=Escherichia coli TaxID=562 RepID=UPI001F26CC32